MTLFIVLLAGVFLGLLGYDRWWRAAAARPTGPPREPDYKGIYSTSHWSRR